MHVTWSDIKVIHTWMNTMKYRSWKNHIDNTNCYGVKILKRGLIRDVPGKVDIISIDWVNVVARTRVKNIPVRKGEQ